MHVNYERVREEEAILLRVQNSRTSSSQMKTEALTIELFEIGHVSRCGLCSSEEVFDTLQDAENFRRTTFRSIVLYMLMTILIYVAEILFLHYYYYDVSNVEAFDFIKPALDFFELLVVGYCVFSLQMFSECLS